MTNPSEKRKYIRLKANHLTRHIKFKLPGKDIYPTQEAKSKDISAGGILFTSNQAYAIGDVLRMELHVPGWEKFKHQPSDKKMPVLVMAKVVRVEAFPDGKYDIGVSFVGIDDAHQQALLKYIAEQNS